MVESGLWDMSGETGLLPAVCEALSADLSRGGAFKTVVVENFQI